MVSNREVLIKSGRDDPGDSLNKKLVKGTVDVSLTSGSGSTQTSHGFDVEPHVFVTSPVDGDCYVSSKGSTNFTVEISGSSAADGTYTVEVLMLRA